ncbi:MAG: hypothetical protein JWO19_5403 [Bryobacterales bacterium]|nr:hypothetical protein [Bryobacterales bacterium]
MVSMMETDETSETPTSKTAEELFLDTFRGDYDDDAPWAAVAELRQRNTPEVFKLAVNYSRSGIALERARALDVLAQLGGGKSTSDRPYLAESVAIAEVSLRDDDPVVVRSAAWALSHLRNDRAVSALIGLKGHPDPGVRWAVASGIAGTGRGDSIQTLIGLMDDVDNEVRDWATFGLGTQCVEDSAEILDALRKRLNDTFEDARSEAIWGLARRRDEMGLRLLLDRLETDHYSGDEMAAAEILGVDYETPAENLRAGLRPLVLKDHAAPTW